MAMCITYISLLKLFLFLLGFRLVLSDSSDFCTKRLAYYICQTTEEITLPADAYTIILVSNINTCRTLQIKYLFQIPEITDEICTWICEDGLSGM